MLCKVVEKFFSNTDLNRERFLNRWSIQKDLYMKENYDSITYQSSKLIERALIDNADECIDTFCLDVDLNQLMLLAVIQKVRNNPDIYQQQDG